MGQVELGLAIAFVAVGVLLRWAWWVRAAVVLPVTTLAAISLLQSRRHTCVLRAAEGTIERDGAPNAKADADAAAASRRMAATVVRDAILIGVACAMAAAATTMVR